MPPPKTIMEVYGPAMAITDQAEADRELERIVVEIHMAGELDRIRALEIARESLAYFAGYYGNETRERVERLFRCEHPIFGSIAERGPPTPEYAFAAGFKMGTK